MLLRDHYEIFKNRSIQKFDILSDGFFTLIDYVRVISTPIIIIIISDRNCMQSTIQIEVNKSNFTCIKCGDKERFKTLPKQSLAY